MPYGSINADSIVTSVSGGVLGGGNASIMKNRIINGAMVISQRNGTSATTLDGASAYTLDRWQGYDNTDGSFTIAQTTTAPTGFNNSLKVTVATTDTSLGATQFAFFRQFIEGYNVADLGWGTANAKTVTVSFWVYSSLTGTFGGAIINDAGDRGYPFSYTISSANTWEQKSITIAGDTTGTWGTTNGTGLALIFGLGVGSSYSGTAGSWQAGFYCSSTGATNVMATSGATFYITGVQLEVGSSATGYEYRQYGTELSLCQRYFELINLPNNTADSYFALFFGYSSTDVRTILRYQVTKRAAASITFSGTINVGNSVRAQPLSGFNYDLNGANSTLIYNNFTATGFTAGSAYQSVATAGTNSSFAISAEL